MLTINCTDHSEENKGIYEQYLKSFEKTMEIPENSDINNAKTRLFNGVFTLIIPKSFCFYD